MAGDTLKIILDDGEEQQRTGDGAPDATRRVTCDTPSAATRRVEDSAPRAQLPLGVLDPGTVLCGEYHVEQTLFPHETQRPGLYLCASDQGQVIVKVYASGFPPKPELWNRLPYLHHPNVLQILKSCEEGGRYYEVQEYCAAGTLEERVPKPGAGRIPVTAEWITEVMLPQVCDALRYLHAQEIIHRDIKPANIYLRSRDPETLVLADFDISSVLEQTQTSRDTTRAGGTWFYTAPEAFPRFVDDRASSSRGRVTRSSDFYSLGITIIELLLGTTSLHLCELPDLFDFYLQGGRVEIPRGLPGQMTLLLRGLLIRNRQTRWGADEIDRWLKNSNTDDDLQRIREDEFYEFARASRPYRLNERQAFDLPSLAEAMFREPEIATEDLITGDVLLNWIGTLNPLTAREIKRDRDKLYMTPPAVLYRAIMRCDSTRPFIFLDDSEVETSDAWIPRAIQILHAQGHTAETFCTPDLLYQLECWLRLKMHPEPEMADRVAAIHATPPRVQLEELAYLLQPDRPYPLMRGLVAHTPEELVRLTYGAPTEWGKKRPQCYDASYQRWFDGALCAWLRQRGLEALATQCDEVREQLGEETFAAFETILRLLDPSLPPVTVEFDRTEIVKPRIITYGKSLTITLPYVTRGCGVPFAAVYVDEHTPGISFTNHVVRQREGKLEIHVDTGQGQQASRSYQVTLLTEGQMVSLKDAPVQFSYRLDYPAEATAMRLLTGAGIGVALFGIPRILAALLGMRHPVSLHELDMYRAWDATMHNDFPLSALAIAVVVFLVGLYFALRIWIRAIRKSEV